MPLNTDPLCITLHVRNSSDTDKEFKISKQLLCDCALKRNRLRKGGEGEKCPHKAVVTLRPAFDKIKANNTMELAMTFRYALLGQQEIHFTLM